MIYIAGPITAKTEEGKKINLLRGQIAASILASKGIEFFCPHTHSFELGYLNKNEFWYKMDMKFLSVCDKVLFLDGWKDSAGCMKEYDYAINNGKKMFFSIKELLDHETKLE